MLRARLAYRPGGVQVQLRAALARQFHGESAVDAGRAATRWPAIPCCGCGNGVWMVFGKILVHDWLYEGRCRGEGEVPGNLLPGLPNRAGADGGV